MTTPYDVGSYRVQPGDAVQCRLADSSCIYGLVGAVRPAEQAAAAGAATMVARVAFLTGDPAVASAWVDFDPDLLLPMPDPELRAFLVANIVVAWPDTSSPAA